MYRYMRAVASLAPLALVACGGAEGGARWAGSVTDSAGVRIVSNTDEAMWSADGGWTVNEELRIGTAAGEAEYQFGQISGIGILSDGRIAVLDQQGQHVKLFSPEGTYLSTLGGPGSGPGEIGRGAGPLVVGAADTLVVPDLGNQRVSLLTPDGESAGSYPIDFREGIPTRWQARPSGRIVSQIRPIGLPNMPAPDTMDAIVTRASDGSALDTLLRVRSGRTFSFAGDAPEFNFFVAEPFWTLAGEDGLVFGVNDEYRLRVFDAAGSEIRQIRKPFEPSPVTDADRSMFTDLLVKTWEDAGVPPPQLELLKGAIHFADAFPAYAQFLAGPDGSLWVQRLQTPSSLPEEEKENFNPGTSLGSPAWDVFDAEGRYLGVVTMPPRFQPLGFAGDRMYGVWRDEFDVQYVMIVRVAGPDSEPAAS
ncbi:MAG: hypothetical protein ACE5HF_03200 [Gemmatimonadota bacterium]